VAIAETLGLKSLVEDVLSRKQDNEKLIVIHPSLYHAVACHVTKRAPVKLYVEEQKVKHFQGAPVL
jgi:hypothetical protein